MHPIIIIVTGRPAAGKSTLAKWLSQELKFPLVSKDSIREQLFDRLGSKDRKWAQELGKASKVNYQEILKQLKSLLA
jgi:dephospho-CoA kinase